MFCFGRSWSSRVVFKKLGLCVTDFFALAHCLHLSLKRIFLPCQSQNSNKVLKTPNHKTIKVSKILALNPVKVSEIGISSTGRRGDCNILFLVHLAEYSKFLRLLIKSGGFMIQKMHSWSTVPLHCLEIAHCSLLGVVGSYCSKNFWF